MTMRTNVILAVVVTANATVASPAIQAQSPRSIWSGIYTESQARRGEELYAQHCSRCHGADLMGLPVTPRFPGAPDRTPALWVNLFNDFYNDLPLGELVERIRISMPQDRPGSLHRKATVDVVAYLLLQSGFPLGRGELTDRLADLREITIVPYRR